MIEYENLKKLNASFLSAYREKFEGVMDSGWFILGNEVKQFEEGFAAYCGNRHCVGVANGLDALMMALKAFSFAPGSEVIVPSNTYIATILAILNAGLKPVLVEPDIRTYNIDPSRIEASLSPKTCAIMVVHLYGKCCDMKSVMEIATRNNLKVVEDCAQAHGAMQHGKKAGTFGDFGAFSFYPTKNLGALGDAGSLNTNSDELAKLVRMMRNYGSEKKYHNEIAGINSRLDEMQAAFLNIKLKSLDQINRHKQKLAAIYSSELNEQVVKPFRDETFDDVFHIYNIRHAKRDQLKEYLEQHGVKTEIHYPVPPHQQKAMKGILDNQPYPLSEEIHATTLSLPISYFHTEEDIYQVVDVIHKFLRI